MPSLQLYPFAFRDQRSGKWVRARHKMQVPENQRSYGELEITGAPEIRQVTETTTQAFNPFERPAQARAIGLGATVGTVRRSAVCVARPPPPLRY
jgi:hypothetical protein